MPQSNPSSELYTLGRGVLSIATFTGGAPGAYEDAGNCTEFNFELTIEELPHYTKRSGLREKDKIVVLEAGYTCNFALDEMSDANLVRAFMGTQEGRRIHGLSNVSQEYALRFKQDNPEGPNRIYEFWRGKLRLNGAQGLIADEWMTLPHVFEGLKDTTNHAESPWFDIYNTTTTTTTTSSSSTTTTTA
jgi:hypothetical protein